jgi:hypothetical protein
MGFDTDAMPRAVGDARGVRAARGPHEPLRPDPR